jgi:folate-dependent tRNA-U54 methylase TrmFO/GidA
MTNIVCSPALQASAATSASTVITAERRAEEAMIVVRSYEHMLGAKRLEIRRCVYSNLMYGSIPLA